LRERSDPLRDERLQAVLRELERRFGPRIIRRLRDARPSASAPHRSVISSGALALDLATGIGGFPRGRIADIVGPVSSGKSAMAGHLLANGQRPHGIVTLIDCTHEANLEQIGRCGVDLSDLFLTVPDTTGEALDVAALLVGSGGLDVLVLGPLAALIGDSPAGGRDAAERLARLNALLLTSPTVVVFLTELRLWPCAAPFQRALRHFASVRILLTPLRPLTHGSGDLLGLRVHAETIKNKLAAPHRHAEFDLRYDRGIHREAELIDLGLAADILRRDPLGICFDHHVLGRGRTQAIATLESDSTLARALHDEIPGHVAT
jgi:recombination protein RecA